MSEREDETETSALKFLGWYAGFLLGIFGIFVTIRVAWSAPEAMLASAQLRQRVRVDVWVGSPERWVVEKDPKTGADVSRAVCPVYVEIENHGEVPITSKSVELELLVATMDDLRVSSDATNSVNVLSLDQDRWALVDALTQTRSEERLISAGETIDERFYLAFLCTSEHVPRVRATVDFAGISDRVATRFVENTWCTEGGGHDPRIDDVLQRLDSLTELMLRQQGMQDDVPPPPSRPQAPASSETD